MGDLNNRTAYEERIATALGRLGARQLRSITTELGDPPALTNLPLNYWQTYQQEIDDTLDPLLEETYIGYGEQVLQEHTWLGLEWDAFLLAAATYADTRARSAAVQMTATTRNKLTQLIARDLPVADFRPRLAALFGPVRNEMVAITEVTDAVSNSQQEVVQQLVEQGITTRPIWFTKEDERVCPICGALHMRPADGFFDDGTPYWIHPRTEVRYPPPPSPHPRCRCQVDNEAQNGVII